ncbi:hypothetical protein GCM10010346_20640 [Streptomyces chryseus]|uniref:N-acetyltransferase domain-containing protein n=1 Tax=Streptomyces chryseus TaxID=68186 RepID=A0ABQ3DLZ4_9ACTN|nr:hypothetical protein GCM10010346_20640 [Streptomyces chryseus]
MDAGFEHGLLVDEGQVRTAGTTVPRAELGYLGTGHDTLTLSNDTDATARVVLLGGTPFEEQIVMWWNSVGRSHQDVVAAREAWENASERFGAVDGHDGRASARPGGETAGHTAYRDRQRVFHHTGIDDAFAGQGLAAVLVQQALSDVRASGKRIVPVCPYVAKFLTKHDEFADITDPVTTDVLRWLKTVLPH